MELIGYAGALLTGVSLGLIGGGGSILIVPILVYFFRIQPTLATAYSLFIVGLAGMVGSLQYARKGLVECKTALQFAIPAFLGVISARTLIVPSLPEIIFQGNGYSLSKSSLIMIAFAGVMLLAATSMIRKKSPESITATKSQQIHPFFVLAQWYLVGVVTGFVGAGGGFLIIPALIFIARLPMKTAVGTSLTIIAANSLLGFIGDVFVNDGIDWIFLLAIAFISVSGIFIGTHISKYVPGSKLQPAFGWFVLIMGAAILSQQLLG